MDDGMDYDVQTEVTFRLDFDGSGDFNILLLLDIQKQFVQHVKEVYKHDDTLGNGYISSDLYFHFNGRTVQLEYTFSCHDENEAEAESFSKYCVQCIQTELESFGCKIRKINCKAEAGRSNLRPPNPCTGTGAKASGERLKVLQKERKQAGTVIIWQYFCISAVREKCWIFPQNYGMVFRL